MANNQLKRFGLNSHSDMARVLLLVEKMLGDELARPLSTLVHRVTQCNRKAEGGVETRSEVYYIASFCLL